MKFNPATFDQVCPKFIRCNAAYCPALGGAHHAEDSICAWLREVVKVGGEARIRVKIPENLFEVVREDAQKLISQENGLSAKLRIAAQSASQIELGQQRMAKLRGQL